MIKNISNDFLGAKVSIVAERKAIYMNVRNNIIGDYGVDISAPLYIHRITKKNPVSQTDIKVSNTPFLPGAGPISLYSLPLKDLELVRSVISDFENRIVELQEELKEVQEIIDYLKTNNLKEFDENEYKVYKVLTLIREEKLSETQIAKRISEIFEQA